MIKMIASDLDGTLFKEDKTFSEEFYDIFNKLKEKDIKFVIATGNQYDLVRDKFDRIKDDIIYLIENGNKIIYKNEILHMTVLNDEDRTLILDILSEFNELMIVFCGNKHSYIHKRFKDKEDFIKIFLHNYVFVDDLRNIDDEIMKYSVADFDENPSKYVELIKHKLPNHIQAVTTGHTWFDIFYKSVNKGTGMKFLQNYFNIDKSECMAFGDQMNDYYLLLSCEESYAMSNGKDELKAIAKYIAKSNEEDGVIEVIRELI
ncbi:MAG: HAD family hydrolase [Bacilli bacterium]|nr:HAD family hydrolase [Bacilli bacterium]